MNPIEEPSHHDVPTADGPLAPSGSAAGGGASHGWRDPDFPSSIGPYRLLQKLGEGGFGAVYLAEQHEPIARRVALKIIKPGMDSRMVLARFEAERQVLAMMDHPNIATVLDAGTTGPDFAGGAGRPYFVMEYVQGVPITQYCDLHRLNTRQRLELFIPVCQAIQHAHYRGVIHRDIKPSNVLVTVKDASGGPIPKVIDFGVSKALHQPRTSHTLFTEMGQLIGTPEYMSPEQAEMSGLDIDTRSDIYSLGVLLYELLIGALPFDPRCLRAAGYAEIQRIIREQDPPRLTTRLSSLDADEVTAIARQRNTDLRTLQGSLRGDLEWITLKTLEKDRTRRYPSAAELAADIQRHLANEPVLAGPPSAAYRMKKFARRHRVALSAAGTIGLAILTGTGLAFWGWADAERSAELALVSEQQARESEAAALAAEQQARIAAQQARDAEAMARREAAKALAVNAFLASMLSSIDPDSAQGREISVRDVLDEASRVIEFRFADQPQVEAALRETIGQTYKALGETDQAERHLLRAVELNTRELGAEHVETIGANMRVASLRADQGRLDEAEALARRGHADLERIAGADDAAAIDASLVLAQVLHLRSNLPEMEQVIRPTVDRVKRVLGERHQQTLSAMNMLAICLKDQGRYDEAEPIYRAALDAAKAALGPNHPDTLLTMNNLALLLHDMGRRDEALPLYRAALEGFERVYGQDHMYTLVGVNNLANLLKELNQLDEAEPLYRRNIETATKVLGPEHPNTLAAMHNLASFLSRRQNYEEAAAMYKQAADLRAKVLGPTHRYTLLSTANLAYVLQQLGRFDEAQAAYETALAGQISEMGADHPETLITRMNFGTMLTEHGRFEQAEPMLRSTLEVYQRDSNGPDVRVALAQWSLGDALRGLKRYEEAEPLLVAADAYLMKELGDSHPRAQKARATLVQLYEAWSKPERAAALSAPIAEQN